MTMMKCYYKCHGGKFCHSTNEATKIPTRPVSGGDFNNTAQRRQTLSVIYVFCGCCFYSSQPGFSLSAALCYEWIYFFLQFKAHVFYFPVNLRFLLFIYLSIPTKEKPEDNRRFILLLVYLNSRIFSDCILLIIVSLYIQYNIHYSIYQHIAVYRISFTSQID